jgi:hypothetical protein
MRHPLLPHPKKSERDMSPAANQPARRIVLMESISERERPLRHRSEQVNTLRAVLRAAIWVAVLLGTFGILAWRMKIV